MTWRAGGDRGSTGFNMTEEQWERIFGPPTRACTGPCCVVDANNPEQEAEVCCGQVVPCCQELNA